MANKHSRRATLLYPLVLNSVFISSSAFAVGTWYNTRNDAMDGTGVASSTYGSAVLANPALMTRAQPENNVAIIFLFAGLQITDKDNKMVDKVDDISDTVDRYKDVINNLTCRDYLNGYPQLKAASADVADQLRGQQS
ncbi:conjugal transfer protein TraF|nr:conjugal transfer protein TraF [Candidatus Pantoea persica]